MVGEGYMLYNLFLNIKKISHPILILSNPFDPLYKIKLIQPSEYFK
jgi:hypothetical protein